MVSQIERNALFPSVQIKKGSTGLFVRNIVEEWAGASRGIAGVGRLDLDYMRAKIAKHFCVVASRYAVAQV